MYTDNVGRKRWWMVYSLGFAALALAHAWPFLKSGTYFIWGADGYSQMYPVFCYFVSYARQMLAGLAHGRLSLPLYDFTLGLGGDILSTLNWHGFGNPFYLLGLLAPENKLPLAFSLIVEVQYFLAGLFFMGYCRKMGLRGFGPVLGAWLYAFTGYFAMTVTHPIMAHAAPALVLMLWGAEKILRQESPLLLAVSVFGTALCGFYFLFICSVALALYILLRVWADRPAHYLKTAAWQALRALAAYLSGLGLACAVFLPSVLGYLGSNRTGEGRTGLPALFVGGRGALEWFAHLTSPSYDWFIGALALLCTAFALGAALTKRPEARGVAGGVIAALVFALSPLAQAALVGFGSSNYTRFWFALSFFFSYLAAVYWPRLFDLSKAQRAAGGALVALYALAAALTGWQRDSRVGLAFFAVLYGVVLLGQKSFRKARRPAWLQPACALLAVGLTLAQVGLGLNRNAQVAQPQFRTARFARQMPAVTGETLPEGVYRTDVSDVGLRRWWTSCNTLFVGGYMGVSEYFSILNGDYANAVLNDWALAAAQQGDFSFRGLDGSTVLNTLAGVRYTFVRPGEEGYVPYDYVYVGDTEQSSRFTITPDNGSTLHRYENQHSLPLGFTAGRVISEQDYMALNGLEKQAALMQGVVLGEAADGMQTSSPDMDCVARLAAAPAEQTDVQWADGLLQAGENGTLRFEFTVEQDTEVWLCLRGFAQAGGEGTAQATAWLEGGQERTVLAYSSLNADEAWVNLGWVSAGDYTAVFQPDAGQTFTLTGLELWGYDLARYEQDVQTLEAGAWQNVVQGTNSLAGLVQSETDTTLLVSLPYSSGWHATVDGVPAEIQKADSMFMAVAVPAGEHAVGLYYITPGLKEGVVLTGLGGLALAAQLIWYAARRRKAARMKPND